MDERKQELEQMEEYDYYVRKPMDLKRLDELPDWKLAEDEPDIRGWKILDKDGNDSGEVEHLVVSSELQEAIFAAVSYGGFIGMGSKKRLVPLYMCDFDEDNQHVIFKGTKDRITGAPDYNKDDTDFGKFYDYWGTERVEGTREVEPTERRVIPEAEEKLVAGKHEEQVGEVEVRKDVEEEEQMVTVPVRKTKFHVYRREVEPAATGEVVIEPEIEEEEEEE